MTFTSSGNTPLLSSKLNSVFYILAPTDEKQICQRMSLYRGVFPFLMEKKFRSINRWTEMINSAVRQAKKLELLQKGDAIVVTAGRYMGVSGSVNSIRLVDVY